MELYYEKLQANITPETLAQLKHNKIILESTSQEKLKGRYSIVVFDSYGTVTLDNKCLQIITQQKKETITEQPYQYLKEFVNRYYDDIEDQTLQELPFISGFIGSCSFDLVRHEFPVLKQMELEDHPQHDVNFYMIEDVYVFDHYKDELYIISTNLFSQVKRDVLIQRVKERIEQLKTIQVYQPKVTFQVQDKEIEANVSEQHFMNIVSDFKKKITEGDMFQVVPSRIYKYKHHFNNQLQTLSFQLYQNLKRQNPSPYMYYINMNQPIIIGSSPESFVKVHNGRVVTNPIAGTIQRGQTPEEDQSNAHQLINDEKEKSEHSMLVDLGRSDIHRICKTGTSHIQKLMEIEKYEHVMHIVSEVTGEIKENISPMSVIASLLPTGTVSGAPKLRAIQRIYEVMPHKRGVYSGGIGYINCNHNLDLALAIRTMMIDDTYVNIEAGCGVVYDSEPDKELEETKLKAKSLLEVSP
ncbi:anthranilate synthase component I [Staphylococcus warneri]|uniref:Anthranilate synthase component 1 n=1 Tax=Staphylococcus warneri TaxID=1292 RepID=A0ABS9NHM2_STAWA|nr:anthranilate synthase component I [Staphylococcus warneri]EGG96052.1 putative para-aminobenzoate synthase, component 1 [Staphylococcus warneri VCU121]KTW25184.1 anthranilate synthase component I [Staphylococcus warneri]MBF2177190.1 anthranilate synthase component I [Staphylococcus warneri]MBF2180400.1 anthranilate synthase component I [Staphylococcus warneri]MBF2184065.1 anthranilate synthase component I [Staphylococcus warneri]